MLSDLPRPGRPFDLLLQFRSLRQVQSRLWGSNGAGARRVVQPTAPDVGAGAAAAPTVREDEPLWWGRELFRSCDANGGPCPEVIDVTGPARCLVFGPHLPLEPGLWRATVIFEVCADAARRVMEVHFGCHPDFTRVRVPIGAPGLHQIELEYEVKPDQVTEVLLWLFRAGFHGQLRFSGVALQKVGARPPSVEA